MADETFVITAGGTSKTIGLLAASASRLTSIDWGDPQPKRILVEGRDGSLPLDDPADYDNRTITLGVEAQFGAGSEDDARAWLQSWSALAAAVNSRTDATLVRTFPTGSTLTAELVSMRVTPVGQLDVQWHQGLARVTLTIEALPALLGQRSPMAGTTAVVGAATAATGVTLWQSSNPVPGDLQALVEVTPTWGATKRSATFATASGVPNVLDGSTSTYEAPANVAFPLKSWVVSSGMGRCHIYAVVAFIGYSQRPQTVTLLREGVFVASGTGRVQAASSPSVAGAYATVDLGCAEIADGSYSLDVGGHGVACSVKLDQLVLVPQSAGGVAASVLLRDPTPTESTIGDDLSLYPAASNLSARSPVFGGTWTTTAGGSWVDSGDGYASNRSHGSANYAGLGDLLVLGSIPACVSGRLVQTSSSASGFGLVLSGPAELFVRPFDGVCGSSPDLAFFTPFPIGTSVDVSLAVDRQGRWWAWAGATGSPPKLVGTGTTTALAGGAAYSPKVAVTSSSDDSARFIFVKGGLDTSSAALTWGQAGTGTVGDLPRFDAGEIARVVVRSARTVTDSFPTPYTSTTTPNPSAVDVVATPRYLHVPED